MNFEFDHLLLTLGSETNFFNMDGVRDWSVTMKSLTDAALLRNRMVALLEEASLQSDEATRRQLLTFVTAGGGFSGTETTGAVNDFVRETVRYYPQLREELIRVVVVHPGNFILPELGEELGRYAELQIARTRSGGDQRPACGELRWGGGHVKRWHIDSCRDSDLDGRCKTQPGHCIITLREGTWSTPG